MSNSNGCYDTVIIGGGPGGISAAIYAIRSGLKTLLIEKGIIGGQIIKSNIIENYPGFPSASGSELMAQFEEHAKSLDTEIKYAEVLSINKSEDKFRLKTRTDDIETRSVIIATGAEPKRLGFDGEEEFFGRGIAYCATCDGPFYKDKPIAVIGGGDTAVKESIFLSKIVSKIYLIHRRDQLRAEKILQDRLFACENVEFKWNSNILKVVGNNLGVTGVVIKNKINSEEESLVIDGAFVLVGIDPSTSFVECDKDSGRFIKTDQNMMSSVAGIFAIGDCRVSPLRQVATAVGDGAIAAMQAADYLSEL